jgi:hypothetical protein
MPPPKANKRDRGCGHGLASSFGSYCIKETTLHIEDAEKCKRRLSAILGTRGRAKPIVTGISSVKPCRASALVKHNVACGARALRSTPM